MSPRGPNLPEDFYEGATPEDLARALLRPLKRPEPKAGNDSATSPEPPDEVPAEA